MLMEQGEVEVIVVVIPSGCINRMDINEEVFTDVITSKSEQDLIVDDAIGIHL